MDHDKIVSKLLDYIYESNPTAEESRPLPLDESLYELGILDSYAVIELVDFIETDWSIRILDSEITPEKMGGVNKMAKLITEKIAEKESA